MPTYIPPQELMLTEAERHTWALVYATLLSCRSNDGDGEACRGADRAIIEARKRSRDSAVVRQQVVAKTREMSEMSESDKALVWLLQQAGNYEALAALAETQPTEKTRDA